MATEKESLQVLENLFDAGKFEDVVKSSENYLKEFPSSFHIGFIRFKALLKSGHTGEAESGINSLLTIYPENINLLTEKGFLILNKGNDQEAREFFEKALFLDPYNQRAKKGLERVKKIEAGIEEKDSNLMNYNSLQKGKTTLEDTISESDLERLMDAKAPPADDLPSPEDSSPNVSISFEDSSVRKHEEILKTLNEKNISEDNSANPGMEEALEKLNKLSESDMEDLKLEDSNVEPGNEPESDISIPDPVYSEDDEAEAPVEKTEPSGDQFDSYATESAAILYLKQKLYNDAEQIFVKMYKQDNPDLFRKKLDMISRVKLLQAKITVLNDFMIKVKGTGDSSV